MKKLIILIILTFNFSCNYDSHMNDRVKTINWNDSIKKDSLIKTDTCIWCVNSFRQLLIDSNIRCVNEVLQSAIWESNWFTSSAFINKHNAFGLMVKDTGCLYFKTVNESVSWYKRRIQNKYYKCGSYYQFLDKYHYSLSDSCYSDKIRKVKV